MKPVIQLSILLTIFGCQSEKPTHSASPQTKREEPAEQPAPTSVTTNTNRPGSYSPAAVNDEEVIAAAEFAVSAQEKRLQQTTPNSKINLEKIMRTEQQVVAGMNYKLTLSVNIDGKIREADAVVWWQAWRNPNPYILTSWEWK